MRRRLLQRLEQRVEGRVRQHVHFVDQVDLVLAGAGREGHLVAQAADLVDAAVAGRVQLDQVHRAAGRGRRRRTRTRCRARRRARLVQFSALASRRPVRGLAGAARPREQVGVRHAAGRQRVRQRRRDVLLAGQLARSCAGATCDRGPRPGPVERSRSALTPAARASAGTTPLPAALDSRNAVSGGNGGAVATIRPFVLLLNGLDPSSRFRRPVPQVKPAATVRDGLQILSKCVLA